MLHEIKTMLWLSLPPPTTPCESLTLIQIELVPDPHGNFQQLPWKYVTVITRIHFMDDVSRTNFFRVALF